MKFSFDVEIKNGKVLVNGQDSENSDVKNYSIPMYALGRNIGVALERSFDISGLYSKQVFWPNEVQFAVEWMLCHRYEITATEHMKTKANLLSVPVGACKAALYGEIIEAELEHGDVKKVVTRLPHRFDSNLDICFAVAFDDDGAHVKTMWLNRKDDNHSTLCVDNYVKE